MENENAKVTAAEMIETEEEKQEIILINEETIRDKIYVIRGQKVMLDFELAEIYGYTTTRFNEQVKNNIEKFDEDFMFQLTKEELEILMSKNSTSSWGGRRKPPRVFAAVHAGVREFSQYYRIAGRLKRCGGSDGKSDRQTE